MRRAVGFRLRRAATIIEVLVVVSVIGVLFSLLLMGVSSVRSSARRTQCENNVRQFGLAAQNHIVTTQFLPTGGWGRNWMGYAAGGFGKSQPGAWAYNLLPFLESSSVYEMIPTAEFALDRPRVVERFALTIPSVFICPSRVGPPNLPVASIYRFYGAHKLEQAAWTDYAVNAGTFFYLAPRGPDDFNIAAYRYPDPSHINGVSWYRSELRPAGITDGLSSTLFAAERWQSEGGRSSFDQPIWSGDCLDLHRFTQTAPRPNSVQADLGYISFGGNHLGGTYAAFCDGSVRLISYRVDELVFADLGNRSDGRPAEY